MHLPTTALTLIGLFALATNLFTVTESADLDVNKILVKKLIDLHSWDDGFPVKV